MFETHTAIAIDGNMDNKRVIFPPSKFEAIEEQMLAWLVGSENCYEVPTAFSGNREPLGMNCMPNSRPH